MKWTRILMVLFILMLSITWLARSGVWHKWSGAGRPRSHHLEAGYLAKLRLKAVSAKDFVRSHGYNNSICFLIDMSLPSGQNRFFIYDLKNDTIHNSGLVTHGNCNKLWLSGRKYGNKVGCGCTSLGRYKVGHSYYGKFGLAYKLHGLDKTNDKAFQRYVVLHSHDCVPDTEVTGEICQSNGCPTVSPGFLKYLKPIVAESPRPVLLWIYE
jgi:hypothetical protein